MMMVRATRDLNADPSHEPSTAARPFDKGATGIVPGEAGAFVVLEREKTAAARGAVPQAELLGYGEWFSVPATTRGLPADTEGTVMSAKKALHDAGLRVEDVDVVVCHGESRNDLDALEARGLADLLGTRSPEVPLVSSTAHIGSVEGATGTLGVGLAVAMMRSGKVPGALHREDPLPEYKGPRGAAATERALRTALVSVTTREGLNAAVVIRKVA
jgi:3-oxoacyl-(acyl-carrier-protein) synthase